MSQTPEDVISKLVYIATNPVKDGLVERVDDWPGINGLRALLDGTPMTAHRPKHFFSEHGSMPETVTVHFTIPPELGDRDLLLAELRERVAAVEQECARTRAQSGRRVLGRRNVLRQSWRDSPTSREPRRKLRPRFAARSLWARLEAIQRNREFLDAYRTARRAWNAGTPIPFPFGTYWLRRFMAVPVAPQILN